MGWGKWGSNKPNVITAEAVKAGASKAVQTLRKEADGLRIEIEQKKKELQQIQPAIDARFKQREDAVVLLEKAAAEKMSNAESRQSDLDSREKQLKKGQETLKTDREGLHKHLETKELALEKKAQDILGDRAELNKRDEDLKRLVASYAAKMGEVDVLKAAVASDRAKLNDDIAAWEAKEKDLSKREAALELARTLLQTARVLNDEKEREIRNLQAQQKQQLKEIQEESTTLKDQRSKNAVTLSEIAAREKAIIEGNAKIDETRRSLDIRKTVMDDEWAKKKKELDDRESNVKKLEALK